MNVELHNKGVRLTQISFGIAFVGWLLGFADPDFRQLGALIALPFCLNGCGKVAQAKGHPWAMGVFWFALRDKTTSDADSKPMVGSDIKTIQMANEPVASVRPTASREFCTHCGAKTLPAAKFCTGCGKPITV